MQDREWPTRARQKSKRSALLEKMSRGVAIFDKDNRLVDCNQTFLDLQGIANDACKPGLDVNDVFALIVDAGNTPGSDPEHFIASRHHTIREQKISVRIDQLQDDRFVETGHIPLQDGGWMMTCDDVSGLFAIKEELEHSSLHDRRTSLPNKELLVQCIDEAFMQKWEEESFALLHLEVRDGSFLKSDLGDEVYHLWTKAVAVRLQECIRDDDLAAKLEGPHFAVVQAMVDSASNAEAMSQRLADEMSKPYDVCGQVITAKFFVGIALPESSDGSEETLLQAAQWASKRAMLTPDTKFAFHVPEETALSA